MIIIKSQLKQNLRTAENILQEFKQEYPYIQSYSYVRTKILQHRGQKNFTHINKKLLKLVEKNNILVTTFREKLHSKQYATKDEYIAETKKLMDEIKACNCDEITDIIDFNVRKHNIKTQPVGYRVTADLYGHNVDISEKNHCFNLIGLKKGAVINNPKTWGNNAVIIDGWLKISGRAQDMLEYYKYLFQITEKEKMNFQAYKGQFFEIQNCQNETNIISTIYKHIKKILEIKNSACIINLQTQRADTFVRRLKA